MQCIFTKCLASTGWSQILLWRFPLCYVVARSADSGNLWQLFPHFAANALCILSGTPLVCLLPACARQHCIQLESEKTNSLRLTAWPIVVPCLLFPQPHWISALRHTVTVLLDDAESGSLNSWLRCSALTIFFHRSLLIIHSLIVYHFCFTAFIIHLLNYGWYIDVCYSRGRIRSYYGISIKCVGFKQHSVFFFITTLQNVWYFCLCRSQEWSLHLLEFLETYVYW